MLRFICNQKTGAFLGIYPREILAHQYKEMYRKNFITLLFIIAKNYKNPKYPKKKTNCGIFTQLNTIIHRENKQLKLYVSAWTNLKNLT